MKQRYEQRESRNRGVSSSNTRRSPRPSSTTNGTVKEILLIPRSVAYIQLFRGYPVVHAGNDLLSNAIGAVSIRVSGATDGILTRWNLHDQCQAHNRACVSLQLSARRVNTREVWRGRDFEHTLSNWTDSLRLSRVRCEGEVNERVLHMNLPIYKTKAVR